MLRSQSLLNSGQWKSSSKPTTYGVANKGLNPFSIQVNENASTMDCSLRWYVCLNPFSIQVNENVGEFKKVQK